VSDCGTVVHSGTVRMVRGVGVPSDGGVLVMGMIGVTTLHPRGMGKPELPPPQEVVLSSSADSLRIVCSDDDPL
jgi:hypothetical protein